MSRYMETLGYLKTLIGQQTPSFKQIQDATGLKEPQVKTDLMHMKRRGFMEIRGKNGDRVFVFPEGETLPSNRKMGRPTNVVPIRQETVRVYHNGPCWRCGARQCGHLEQAA